MTTDERNFRSIYYEKVGFKSVEEKKSLEMLLKEKPLDRGKLKQFCLRFTVPHAYRSVLWKLLLGVIPTQVDCQGFVMDQRKQEYNDLYHTLIVTKIIDEKTPKTQIFLSMWLIQTGNFTFDFNLTQEKNFNASSFTAIVKCLLHFFDDDTDIFWIARKFYDNILRIHNDVPKLLDCTYSLLEKEDPEFYKSLVQNGVLENLPLNKWFDCCFAGIFNENCIVKIWDKVCGGSYKILAFLVTALLNTLKHRILKLNDIEEITHYIQNIPEETADIIVNKTIDMWQHYGSPLTVHDKPKAT